MERKNKNNSSQKRLVLLDAHAIIHRAYHALPDFTSPQGEPTGALYGLSTMLFKIIEEFSPDYIIACYDLPKPTYRHLAYEAYKGTRSKTEDELVHQLKRSRDVFSAFHIPAYDAEGFEADDILGTFVEAYKKSGLDIIIASGDMDTLQLIDGGVARVYTLKKGIQDTILYDEKAVIERFGFSPDFLPDYKGLRGDPSDNIIGIPGIGEKTATTLIQTFGSLEDMYKTLKENPDAFTKAGIKPRIVELLKTHEDDAEFSKVLATIRRDAPIDTTLPESWVDKVDAEKLIELFQELGFRSLRERARSVLGMRIDEKNEEAPLPEAPDETRFKEASIMLWLLSSDITNPTLDDMCERTKTDSFEKAYPILKKEIAETGRLQEVYEAIEKPLIPIVQKMEQRGVCVDLLRTKELSENYRKELEIIDARIIKTVGHPFNINSPRQLADVLFDELGLVAKGQKKTATGMRSTRESELEKIRDLHPIVSDIFEYRELQKLLSTYLDPLPAMLDADNRLHATFLQTGTTTGRMASQNPNLQNIPVRTERGRAIRDVFVAPKGYVLLALDYSQIELRIAAILSGDEKLKSIFVKGDDVHAGVASEVFGVPREEVDQEQRRRAKIINFGILYGMGVQALKKELGTSLSEAQAFYSRYFETFKTLAEYMETVKGHARKYGYTETLFGRRRYFEAIRSPLPHVRASAERMAINAPIQGTQADIIKRAMITIDALLAEKEDTHLVLQVHDELIYEVKEDVLLSRAHDIRTSMEEALPEALANGVPIIASASSGIHWGALTKL